jgi:putative transposase
MPRQPRNFEEGGIYHIVSRGVEKRDIYLKPQDYSRFVLGLELCNTKEQIDIWNLINREGKGGSDPPTLSVFQKLQNQREKNKKSGPIVELMAFALMPNHYHLIVREITDGGTSLFMQKMGGYTTYFNGQYDRVGPLFQSRYKSVRIKDDRQFMNIFVYVHTNPVELIEPKWKDMEVKNNKKALDWLSSYKWSSYQDYIGKKNFPTATQRDFFLEFFGGKNECRKAVEDWISFSAENAELGQEIID